MIPTRPRLGTYTSMVSVPIRETKEVPKQPPVFEDRLPMFNFKADWFIDELDGLKNQGCDMTIVLTNLGIATRPRDDKNGQVSAFLSDMGGGPPEEMGEIAVTKEFFKRIKGLKKSVPPTSVIKFDVSKKTKTGPPMLRMKLAMGTCAELTLYLADAAKGRKTDPVKGSK